jgi:peptidase M28-like protein
VDPDRAQLEADVRALAAIARPSASDGERRSAEWIAARLRECGFPTRVEEEAAHGTYWWPLGLCNAIAVAGGALALPAGRRRRARRALGAAVAAVAAAAVWDDVGIHRHWFRRALLPYRSTWNVVAEAGDRDAREVLIVAAHHDAAHSGLIYAPGLGELVARRLPRLWDRVTSSPPLLWLVFGGPALIAAGALFGRRRPLRAGLALATGSTAAFVDIGLRDVVPGANDNLSAVAALLGAARALQRRPLRGLRVVLLFPGSEESFEEGMQAFARRHFPHLSPRHTRVLALETVGCPHLTLPEAEGMLIKQAYDHDLRELIAQCARELQVPLWRGLKLSFSSDALVGLRWGFPTAMLGSLNEFKAPSNYHWPTDVPENVDYRSVADTARVVEALARRLAADAAARA